MKNKFTPSGEINLEISGFTPKGEAILSRLHPDIDGYTTSTPDETDAIRILKWLAEADPLFATASLRKAATDMKEAAHDLWGAYGRN